MSRSYKKNPIVTDHHRRSTRVSKRFASKAFRNRIGREDEMAARPQHKKYFSSYNICDYKTRLTKDEAIEWYYNRDNNPYFYKRYPTLKAWLNYWEKCYIRK